VFAAEKKGDYIAATYYSAGNYPAILTPSGEALPPNSFQTSAFQSLLQASPHAKQN